MNFSVTYTPQFAFSTATCPHCMKVNEFVIIKRKGGIWLSFLLPIYRGTEYLIACSQCKYTQAIHKSDLPHYQSASQAYQQLLRGELSLDVFEKHLSDLKLETYAGMIADAAKSWICPDCGEENPGEFSLCFNCQHERVDSEPVEADSLKLPEVGGGDVWEHGHKHRW